MWSYFPQISQLQIAVVDAQKDQLRRENQHLRQEVDSLKRRLVDLEKSQGIKQVNIPPFYLRIVARLSLLLVGFFWIYFAIHMFSIFVRNWLLRDISAQVSKLSWVMLKFQPWSAGRMILIMQKSLIYIPENVSYASMP